MPPVSAVLSSLKSSALDFGFDLCSVTKLAVSDTDKNAYSSWLAAGHAADMAYLSADPNRRLKPDETFPGMRSVITLGVSYYQGPFPEKPGLAYGRVARYAWGEDYHPLLLKRLDEFAAFLRQELGHSIEATVAVDTKPLLERALARASGTGFIGKNTLLIAPRSNQASFHVGSYLFLAEILVNVDLTDEPAPEIKNGCGGCTKCLVACPTDAFDGPYRLKAERCIAYLTIENKGSIPHEMRPLMGDWVFGCDVCQEVCPYNARAMETRWPQFQADRGAGAWVSLTDILGLKTTVEFKKKWGATALSRPKRRGLIRNACVAAGNSGDESLLPLLDGLLSDAEPIIREHALWALSRLAPRQAKKGAEWLLKNETDEKVRNECHAVL